MVTNSKYALVGILKWWDLLSSMVTRKLPREGTRGTERWLRILIACKVLAAYNP